MFRTVLVAGCIVWLSACGSGDRAPAEAGGAGGSSAGAEASAAGGAGAGTSGAGGMPAASDACGGDVVPGDETVSLVHEGQTRAYLVHVPPTASGESPLPLVLNFHGYTSTAVVQQAFSGMNAAADSEGFVVAYPQGRENSWNAGTCCGGAFAANVDDVGFVRAVVADIQRKVCVDGKRIYATGMSNGGFMAHRLACDAADLFAAVAPVAGVMMMEPAACQPSRPISLIHFHGTGDTIVRYEGGGIGPTPSVAESFTGWAARDGCSDAAATSYENGVASCKTHSMCADGVELTLCTIEGGGHCWPGTDICTYGMTTSDVSVNTFGWNFLKRFSLH